MTEDSRGQSLGERLARTEALLTSLSESTAANTLAISRLTGLLHSRPSWAVASILGFLSTACGVSVTALLTLLATR